MTNVILIDEDNDAVNIEPWTFEVTLIYILDLIGTDGCPSLRYLIREHSGILVYRLAKMPRRDKLHMIDRSVHNDT